METRRNAHFGEAIVAAVIALAVGACSDDSADGAGSSTAPPPGDAACSPGELTLADGRCLAAGLQETGCPAELELAGGIHVQDLCSLTVRSCVVEGVHYAGIMVMDSTAVIEQTSIRDTLPVVSDGTFGVGIAVVDNSVSGLSSTATVKSSKLTNNRFSGITVAGSDAEVESTLISDTLPAEPEYSAIGAFALPGADTKRRSQLTIRSSRIERGGVQRLFPGVANECVRERNEIALNGASLVEHEVLEQQRGHRGHEVRDPFGHHVRQPRAR